MLVKAKATISQIFLSEALASGRNCRYEPAALE
ncbi:hypothetical protein SM11_chr3279 [Sinorhizobium meliloti SM11]|uniref:Uncharacterized protein n=1 Tax=Sinorhizobium meliloti (strain SM11) TaxID=707241 RepID=F7X0H9_SINMM|nr:hypothetical protein SM11_chr3279 [Sinorhizobium meliloti SM11]